MNLVQQIQRRTFLVVSFLLQNPTLLVLIGLVAVVTFWFYGEALTQKWRDYRTDRTITRLDRTSDANEAAAKDQLDQAYKASVTRQLEDLRRHQELEPARQRAAVARAISHTRTQKAQTQYENSITADIDPGPDARALHDRNCADFRALYPDDVAAHCSQ